MRGTMVQMLRTWSEQDREQRVDVYYDENSALGSEMSIMILVKDYV